MTKWEYLYVDFDTHHNLSVNGQMVQEGQGSQGKTLQEYSNWLGQQGWEIVGTLSVGLGIGTIIFKRPQP